MYMIITKFYPICKIMTSFYSNNRQNMRKASLSGKATPDTKLRTN